MKFIIYLLVYLYIMIFPTWLCWTNKTIREIAKIENNKSTYFWSSVIYFSSISLIIILNILFIGGLIRGK